MADQARNIVFIVTDQERYLPALPTGYELPGRQRLQELGVTFTNHNITSNVCTPSRSTIYTGQQIDPDEANNLAVDPIAAEDTILRMNSLLNRLIDDEVGVDDGSFLPTGTEHPWEVERWDV